MILSTARSLRPAGPLKGFRTGVLSASLLVVSACSGPTSSGSGETGEPEPQASAGQVNVYSARHYDSDDLLYAAFEAETGIDVRVREAGSAQLLETMKAEGANSPADVILAADAGTLWRFKDAGLTQPIGSDAVEAAIPARLRDVDGHWTGLAKRYRVIAYDPERFEAADVQSIEALADPKFEGEVCVRASSNIYNLSLMAELIERLGPDAAAAWAEGVVSNFARQPRGGDTAQIEGIAAGACGVAIVNHYYWVRMAESGSEAAREAANAVALSFASAGDGVHTNISGAALAANAPNPDAARQFIEYLTSAEGQTQLVTETREVPIVEGARPPEGLDRLPDTIDESDLPLSVLGENQAEAQRLYDRAGWN